MSLLRLYRDIPAERLINKRDVVQVHLHMTETSRDFVRSLTPPTSISDQSAVDIMLVSLNMTSISRRTFSRIPSVTCFRIENAWSSLCVHFVARLSLRPALSCSCQNEYERVFARTWIACHSLQKENVGR